MRYAEKINNSIDHIKMYAIYEFILVNNLFTKNVILQYFH